MGKAKDLDCHLELLSVLNYDAGTGVFTYRRPPRHLQAGDVAGYRTVHGYIILRYRGHAVRLHRVAFLFLTGRWPNGEVDHINGDRADNRACNLRDVSHVENQANRKATPNKTGYPNVKRTPVGRWAANIQTNGRRHFLGSFETPEEAYTAFIEAKRRLHPGGRIPRVDTTIDQGIDA